MRGVDATWTAFRAKIILVALPVAFALTACVEEKPKNVLIEAIDVQGTCSEDHVGTRDDYAGQIVRWQMADTKKIVAYGFVFKKGNLSDQIRDELDHPFVYHTPRQVSFLDPEINVDTSQTRWRLPGVSDRGESPEDAIQGYNSTCDLEVLKRGKEIRLNMDLAGAIKQ